MFRRILYIGSALLVGIVLGLGSLLTTLIVAGFNAQQVGPWAYNPSIGSEATGMYWRALISIFGFLALPKEESIYFNAQFDGNGDWLKGDETYRVTTGPLDCRWWSVTVYGKTMMLIPNDEHRYSFNVQQLEKNKEGNYVFYVAPESPGEGKRWIPTGHATVFDLTLRTYNPSDDFRAALNDGSLQLPKIERVTEAE